MNRKLKFLLAASSMSITAGALIGPIYAVFVEEIGGDLLDAGGAYGIYAGVAAILTFLFSRWEDHVRHQEKLVVFGYALGCIGFLCYGFIRSPLELFLVQMVFGISDSIKDPAYDGLYSKFLDKGKFVSEWGMWETMYYVVTAAAATVGGFVATFWGFQTLFGMMFLFSLMGLTISTGLFFRNNYTVRYYFRRATVWKLYRLKTLLLQQRERRFR